LFEERGTPSHQGGVFFHANQQKLYHKKTIQHAIFGWFVNARSTDRPTNEPTKQPPTSSFGELTPCFTKRSEQNLRHGVRLIASNFQIFPPQKKGRHLEKKKRVMASSSTGVSFFQNAHFHLFPVIPSG
jgi:hypothetical protein